MEPEIDRENIDGDTANGRGISLRIQGPTLQVVNALHGETGIPKSRILGLGAMALARELGDEEMLVQMPKLAAILSALDAKAVDLLLELDYIRKLVIQALTIEADLPLKLLGPEGISDHETPA